MIIAFLQSWKLALICITPLPLIIITATIVTKMSTKFNIKEIEAYNVAGTIAEEVLSSIRTVFAFNGQENEMSRYKEKLIFSRDINIKKGLIYSLGTSFIWLFNYINYALVFWYAFDLVIGHEINNESLVIIFICVLCASINFIESIPYFESLVSAIGAGAKIFKVIDNTPVINIFKNDGIKPSTIKGKITFKNVYFHFPARDNVPIFNGFNMIINPGEKVALVGSSGCGKSTCIHLIQRFYDPVKGSVCIDENDICSVNLTWLRNNIGVVGQESVLFSTTIFENIKYGNPNATQEDIEQAAKKSNAHDFIMSFPQGYNTLVGERGAQLSGGQKQRIAIARALVRNPAILLLDEATSALDTDSEAKVQAALEQASQERTTIIVAHRLTTIKNVDKIVVVSEGKVVEQGQHDELMALHGVYYNLITAQVSSDEFVDLKESVSSSQLTAIKYSEDSEKCINEINNSKDRKLRKKTNEQYHFWWSIILMNIPEWPYTLIGCIAAFVSGILNLLYAITIGDVFSVFASVDYNVVIEESYNISLRLVIIGIVQSITEFLKMLLFTIAGEKLTLRLRGKMFEAMLKQEIAWFDRKENGTGKLCSRLSSEAAYVQGATGQRIGIIFNCFFILVVAISFSMYYEYRTTLIAFCFLPLTLIIAFLQERLLNKDHSKSWRRVETANNIAVEAITNIRTVASLSCEDTFHDIYISHLDFAFKSVKRNMHLRGIILGLTRGLATLSYTACWYYGINLVIHENVQYSNITRVVMLMLMNVPQIAHVLAFTPNFQKGLDSAASILKLLNRKSLVQDSPVARNNISKQGDLLCNNVYFSYPTRPENFILNGINLKIIQDKTVALIGPSGCGKSTIIQLLERFYDPVIGEVNIDDNNIRHMNLTELRFQLGIVSQEPSLFDRTIVENIAYGDNSRQIPRSEIIAAAQKANIHNFIVSLPMGYDTRLGEKGTQLSGGQKQRIAIARALVRNPKFLLLDEATSALDTESEKVVQETLNKAKEGRTCITIAHRLSTIQDADVICVMNKGTITELGTHNELMNQRGLYYNLRSLQNR